MIPACGRRTACRRKTSQGPSAGGFGHGRLAGDRLRRTAAQVVDEQQLVSMGDRGHVAGDAVSVNPSTRKLEVCTRSNAAVRDVIACS